MAIQIFCTNCKTSLALDTKKCSKCWAVLGREKKYRVCVSVQGKRVTKVCENLTIARDIEMAVKTDMLRGEYEIQKQKQLTLDQVWEKYLPWAKEHKRSWADDRYYYNKHLKPRFGSKKLDAISPFDIEKMKIELAKGTNKRGKPYAKATIKHQIVILRRLFNIAIKWGLYRGENPVTQVSMPKIDNQKTEFLTDEQLRNLLETLETWPNRDTVSLIKFALFTGLRRGELFKLQWGNVDLERGTVTLKAPKGGKTQTIPISEEAMIILEGLRDNEISSPYVFPGKDGEKRRAFKGPWERIRKAAGLPDDFRFHGLRHNYASVLVSNGVDLAVVRELLTHKDMKTTSRYAHLAPGKVKEAALKSGKLLNSKNQPQDQFTPKGASVLKRTSILKNI